MQKYSDTVLDSNGNVISGAAVTVQNYPAGTSATVYGSNAVGANVNPLTTDGNGYFEFYAPNGKYSLQVSKTGITTRTVTNILIQDLQVSVMEYGAKGDGVTDDAAAIQAAHDALYNAGGGTVVFPAGTFIIGQQILFRDNVHWVGAGRGVTIVKLKSGSTVPGAQGLFTPNSVGGLSGGYYCRNVSFRHFSIDGNDAGTASVHECLAIYQVKDCLLFDMETYNASECGVAAGTSNTGTDQKQGLLIIGCISHNNAADGFQVAGAQVVDCYAHSNTQSGFNHVGTYSGVVKYMETQFVNCKAEANGASGFSTVLQAGNDLRTLCVGCVAMNNAVGFTGAMKYSQFISCEAVYNTGHGFNVARDQCTVLNCLSKNNAQGGTGYGVNVDTAGLSFLRIEGNTCTDDQGVKTQQYGIGLTFALGTASNTIKNNVIAGNINAGINNLTSQTGYTVTGNESLNPIGPFLGAGMSPANPAVPASTVTKTNNYGYPCRVYIVGGTVTVIAIAGTATGLTAGGHIVGPGETIAITYTVAPTWQWFGL